MRHVSLTCKHHPNLRWMCKSIAFTPGRGYNGARHIFFNGTLKDGALVPGTFGKYTNKFTDECRCPATDLILSPEEVEEQKTDPTYTPEGRDIA